MSIAAPHRATGRRSATWLALVSALLLTLPARAVQLPGPLVSDEWLARHRGEVTVLDVRADPAGFTREPRYYTDPRSGDTYLMELGGHIPGAVLVDFATLRQPRQVNGRTVDKLVPEREAFERLMRSYGLQQGDAVVITTRGESHADLTFGTRLYWQLKYYGHDRVAMLDGGLASWVLNGHPVSVDSVQPETGNWQATAQREELLATSEQVARAAEQGDVQLMDTRPVSQYLGTDKRPYVSAAGHIPGAKVYPTELLAEPDAPARFLPEQTLRTLVREMGLDPQGETITYCNSGQLASGGWFILSELLGNRNVKLYDGSMHQWALEQRPVSELKME